MMITDIWRRISLYLDNPFYIYQLNNELYKKRNYSWLVPQHIKSHFVDDTLEIAEMPLWYNNLNDYIRDLKYIIDKIINYREKINTLGTKILYDKNKYNLCQTNIKYLISNYHDIDKKNCINILLDNKPQSHSQCYINSVYRLAPVTISYINKQTSIDDNTFLQFKSLIY